MTELQELYDQCYECTGYGDDFRFDEDSGELVSSCDTCWVNERIAGLRDSERMDDND